MGLQHPERRFESDSRLENKEDIYCIVDVLFFVFSEQPERRAPKALSRRTAELFITWFVPSPSAVAHCKIFIQRDDFDRRLCDLDRLFFL